MDRLLIKRGLVALCGLALISTASGCRDRNLRVPPAQYSEGAAPGAEAYPASPLTPTDPATIDPYAGAAYDATGYGATSGYDPAAAPAAAGYDPAAGSYDPAAAGASYGSYPTASNGTDPSSPTAYDANAYGGTLASPSSPGVATPYDAGASAYPSPGMETPAAADYGSPAALPGLGGDVAAPPIPDTLPMMP